MQTVEMRLFRAYNNKDMDFYIRKGQEWIIFMRKP